MDTDEHRYGEDGVAFVCVDPCAAVAPLFLYFAREDGLLESMDENRGIWRFRNVSGVQSMRCQVECQRTLVRGAGMSLHVTCARLITRSDDGYFTDGLISPSHGWRGQRDISDRDAARECFDGIHERNPRNMEGSGGECWCGRHADAFSA